MNLLLSAYACDPSKGSEEGTGFSWLWETAKLGHEVWCLTTPRGRASLEKELARRAADPAAGRIHLVYVTVPRVIDFAYRWQVGVYLHYLVWQYRAWRVARQLDTKVHFNVVHHVTYNSLQMASWLWRLEKPLLLGPLGGGMQAPASLRRYLPDWFKTETVRNVISGLLITFDPNVRQSLRHAALVLAANSETAALAAAAGRPPCFPAMSAALPDSFLPAAYAPRPPLAGRPLRILWLARLFPRKGLHLVLAALGQVDKRVHFSPRHHGRWAGRATGARLDCRGRPAEPRDLARQRALCFHSRGLPQPRLIYAVQPARYLRQPVPRSHGAGPAHSDAGPPRRRRFHSGYGGHQGARAVG